MNWVFNFGSGITFFFGNSATATMWGCCRCSQGIYLSAAVSLAICHAQEAPFIAKEPDQAKFFF
jgi:hypothetical protein